MAKILLVDDDDQLLSVLSSSLKKEGYLVELCFNKEEASDHLAMSSYDIMVFDVTDDSGKVTSWSSETSPPIGMNNNQPVQACAAQRDETK